MIEDNEADVALVRAFLKGSEDGTFDVLHSVRLGEGIARVKKGGIDVVLLDMNLPDSRGLSTFLSAQKAMHHLPIIVLSGIADTRIAVSAVQAGAQDFLDKGNIDTEVLVRSIRYAIERKATASALEASEIRFRSIVQGSADGIVILDRTGAIIFANPAAGRLFDKPEEELLGTKMPLTLTAHGTNAFTVSRSDMSVATETKIVGIDWHGEPGWLVTLRDLTERVRIEQLEARFDDANSYVAKLQELDRMRSEFIESVTHELRTPMTPLSSAIEMLLDGTLGDLNDDQKTVLDMMSRNVSRLSRFATNVLALSRLENGRYPVNPHRLELGSTLRPAVDLLRGRAAEQTAIIAFQIPDGIEAHADPDALCQVVTNLVENALAHNDPGVSIAISAQERDDGTAEILVSDTGKGIAPEDQEKVFARFVQVDRQSGPGYRGTGLGLPICRGLVEKMGGKLRVDSTPGEGATFSIRLHRQASTEAPFGRLAVMQGFVSPRQLDWARGLQRTSPEHRPLGDILVEEGLMTAEQKETVLRTQARRTGETKPP